MTQPKAIFGGFHLRALPADSQGRVRCIHALQMIYNWRMVVSVGECDHIATGISRGWCYEGAGLETLLRVVGQAIAWDGSDDTEPEGWIKATPSLE